MQRDTLITYMDNLLEINRFHDYCPNGLQIEGRDTIQNITVATTASAKAIEQAIDNKADALLVHHGYFWKSEAPTITGIKQRRIKALLQHNINLIAYHLPLDAHPELGNNSQLAHRFGFTLERYTGNQGIIAIGYLEQASTLNEITQRITTQLARTPLVIGDPSRIIKNVAWCSGGAQDYFQQVLHENIDLYITGEASEHNYHTSLESGIAYIAAGHHATERYGVIALAHHLQTQFGIAYQYAELDNPI